MGKNSAAADPGSLYTVENAIKARSVWLSKDSAGRQITGQGVIVALLDSGTASVAGLDRPGKTTFGPDLSIEGNGVLTQQDSFGHGTHMAGIIAARDAAVLTAKTIPTLSPTVQLGVAPDAKLLAMKLATTDGSTDVSQVIAALDWVTEHRTSADGSRVRVVNLSFGTASLQSYQLDPLAAAAENAWRHGLVVVVSGGNGGAAAGRLTDPAMDPYVLAVVSLRWARLGSRVEQADRRWLYEQWYGTATRGRAGSRSLDRVASSPRIVRRRQPPGGPGQRRHHWQAVPEEVAPAKPQQSCPGRPLCCYRPTRR